MKTIVATSQPELNRELERDLLRRAGLRVVVARTIPDVVERLRQGASLCLLTPALRDGGAGAALSAIRADKRVALLPVVLLMPPGLAGRAGEIPGDFDEVLCLPAPPGVISALLGRLLGLPVRAVERFPVRVHVFSEAEGPVAGEGVAAGLEDEELGDGPLPDEYLGTTIDLSEAGVLLRTRRALAVGERLALRFSLPGRPGDLDLRARVVRVEARAFAPGVGVGLCFERVSEVDRKTLREYLMTLMAGRPFRWHIVREGERQVISLLGVLRADSDLTPLSQLRGELDFHLREFRRISSDSIQNWLDLIRSLTGASQIRLFECPIAFVQQANAISNLLDQTEVVSFFAPYMCPRCGLDEERLIDVKRDVPATGAVKPPSYPCSSCGATLTFDDLPERYFAFLGDREPPRAAV